MPLTLHIDIYMVWVCLLGMGYQCDVWVSQIVFVLVNSKQPPIMAPTCKTPNFQCKKLNSKKRKDYSKDLKMLK
jgi:hypothetical protein